MYVIVISYVCLLNNITINITENGKLVVWAGVNHVYSNVVLRETLISL